MSSLTNSEVSGACGTDQMKLAKVLSGTEVTCSSSNGPQKKNLWSLDWVIDFRVQGTTKLPRAKDWRSIWSCLILIPPRITLVYFTLIWTEVCGAYHYWFHASFEEDLNEEVSWRLHYTVRLLASHINDRFLEAISVAGKRDLVLALFGICSHVREVI